jgi:hypothetical protein
MECLAGEPSPGDLGANRTSTIQQYKHLPRMSCVSSTAAPQRRTCRPADAHRRRVSYERFDWLRFRSLGRRERSNTFDSFLIVLNLRTDGSLCRIIVAIRRSIGSSNIARAMRSVTSSSHGI